MIQNLNPLLQVANINIVLLINSIGVFSGGAVPPLLFVLVWRGCTGPAATTGESPPMTN